MKAVVCTKYGSPDVLQLAEVPRPAPKNNEILVKVHATTVTSADCRVRSFASPLLFWLPMRLVLGLRKPRRPILGVELAGEVAAVGRDVKRFKAGDAIYAMSGMRFGAYAEYVCLPERGVVAAKPANATFEEAAAIPFGGTTALHFLRKGNIARGQRVLVYGASGAVGTAAVQLAKHYFGTTVTAVCSAANAKWVQALGADNVLEYAPGNFADGKERYDIVFDAVGKCPKSERKRALAPNGSFVTVEGQGMAKERVEDMALLAELVEAGRFAPVIDRRYPLERIPEAHRYVEQGRKKGNVVITVVQ